MTDLKDDGRPRTSTTQAPAAEVGTISDRTISDKDEKEKQDPTAKTDMPPSGGYQELRSEEDPRDPYQDKEDGAEVELRATQSPVDGEPSTAAPGDEVRESGEGGEVAHEYKVYKRRWFGLVQLTLLNIIVSWDVSALLP
jgi:hypothetical protein